MYKRLLKSLAQQLKEYGFRRRGKNFYVQQENNWGLINFQKSGKSDSSKVLFTINVGVCSSALIRFQGKDGEFGPPLITECQWRFRIGSLLPGHEDRWWGITEITGETKLRDEIQYVLQNVAVPAILDHIGDDALIAFWTSGRGSGTSKFERLMDLSTLLKLRGRENELSNVIAELKMTSAGKPTSFMVQQHIEKLSKI